MKNAMRKLISISFVIVVFISACKKDNSTTPTPDPTTGGNTNVSTVPSTFTQKVLMEIFTGASQPQCTDGFVKQDAIVNANTTKAIVVNVHYSDALELMQYTTLSNNFSGGNPMTFPSAMINRTASLSMLIFNRTQWQSNFDVDKVKTAKCGLAMETSISGSTATIKVHAGFNETLSGNYNISVYLVENDVSGSGNLYDQRNSYNTTTGHPYYGLGDPILNFKHYAVLRKVISAPLGDLISTSNIVAGGEEIKTYSTSISGYNSSNLYVVAFISRVGTTTTTQDILNVQRVQLGQNKNWD